MKKYENGKDYVNKKVETVKSDIDKKKEKKNIKQYYEDLYDEYCDNNELTLDEFCNKKELTERDKKILYLMEEEENLKASRDEELNGILNDNLGRRK